MVQKLENVVIMSLEEYEGLVGKPEEKPKVGDVCKFWDDDENAFVVATYAELRNLPFPDLDNPSKNIHGVRVAGNYHTRFYRNCQSLTPIQVQELLFGKEVDND